MILGPVPVKADLCYKFKYAAPMIILFPLACIFVLLSIFGADDDDVLAKMNVSSLSWLNNYLWTYFIIIGH